MPLVLDGTRELEALAGLGDQEPFPLLVVDDLALELESQLLQCVPGIDSGSFDGLEVDDHGFQQDVGDGAIPGVDVNCVGAGPAPQGLLESEGLVVSDSCLELERDRGLA